MSNEYTPTTGEVREAVNEWVWSRRMWRPELSPSDGMEFDRWLAGITAERDAALSTIAKVEALHRPVEIEPSDTICGECSYQLPNGHYFGKVEEWPCPTIRALGSVPSTGERNE